MAQTRGWSRDEKDDRANTLAALIQKAWRAVMRALLSNNTSMVSLTDLNELPSLWAQQVDGPLLGYLGMQVLDGAERVRQDVGLGPKEQLLTEDLVEEHLRQAASRFRNMSDDVWDAVRAQLMLGYASDENVKQIAARIKHVGNVSDAKAMTIARTEIHAALEAGSFAQAAMVDPDGKKSWLATNDSHTRPTHEEADGQTRKIAEPFRVGLSQLQYPGDPAGALDETINCRCSVTYELFPDTTVVDDEVLALTASVTRKWVKEEHPRGKDGRFISKGPLADFFKMNSPTFAQLQGAVNAIDSQKTWDNLTDKQQGWISKLTHGISSSPMSDPLKHKISGFEANGHDSDTHISTPVPENTKLDTPPAIPHAITPNVTLPPEVSPVAVPAPNKSSLPSSKKFVPATIHKPHQDGTVVAVSADGTHRLRWSTVLKKYQLQQKSTMSDTWYSVSYDTKTDAYKMAKDDHWDWRQPAPTPEPTAPPVAVPLSPAVTELKPLTSLPNNDKHVALGLAVLDVAKTAQPGEVLIKGYNKNGEPITIRKTNLGYPLAAYLEGGDGTSFAQFHNNDEFNQWWIDNNGGNDIAWDANTLGSKTKDVTPNDIHLNEPKKSLLAQITDIGKNVTPGMYLMSGETSDGEQIYLQKNKSLDSYSVVGEEHVLATANDVIELKQMLADPDFNWNEHTLISNLPKKTTPTGVVENTWWEPDDELTTDDLTDVSSFGKPGTTIGVTTDGSLALTYNVKTSQLEMYKRAQSSDKWVLVDKFHLPSDPKYDGAWEDSFADATAYNSNEGVKSWLKGDVAAPHYGVPTNISEHNVALGDLPPSSTPHSGEFGLNAWNEKLTPEYVNTLVKNQVVATVTTDLGDFRVIAGGTSLPNGDMSKFRIQKKSTQGDGNWMTLETNVTLNDLSFAVQDHSGTSKWNIVDAGLIKIAPNPGADITNVSPAQVGVIKTFFNANGAKWHNKPEAIWDALQSFKTSSAGVGNEHLTNMQILAALDASLPSGAGDVTYTGKMKKWLKTKKGLDYVIAHPDVKKPAALPATSDEHPGTSLIMKALADPNMKNYTVIANKNLASGDTLVLEKGQFDQNILVYKNGTAVLNLQPSEVDTYLKLNDDNGDSWKIYPTPGGPPVYATMSGKKPPLTPDVSTTPQPVKSFAEMDKWPWIPGDIVATRADGEWRVTYTDQSKFSLETNTGTNDKPEWTTMLGMTEDQSSLLGFFPLDTVNMTHQWYPGKPGGSDETLTPGLSGGPATSDEIWNATPSFGPATLAKTLATGVKSTVGGDVNYKIKQDGDGEGFKKLTVYVTTPNGVDTPTSYDFTTQEQLTNFMNYNIVGKNTVWTLAPESTEGEVHDVSFAPSTTPVVDKFTGLSTTPNAFPLKDGTPTSIGFTIPSDGWESIGDINPGFGYKLHAVTPGKDYILVSNNGGYQIRKYDPKHNKYTYFAEGPNAKKLALDHADNWTYAVDLSDQNLINLADGATVDKGPVIKVWKDLAGKKYGNAVLAYTADGQYRIKAAYGGFDLQKWSPVNDKWLFQKHEQHKLASLAKSVDNATWHDATVVPPAAAPAPKPVVPAAPPTPPPPPDPVGVHGTVTLPNGTKAPLGPWVNAWGPHAKKSQYKKSTVIARSKSGTYRIIYNKPASQFELHKWNETDKQWKTEATESYKLASLAKNSPVFSWYENKAKVDTPGASPSPLASKTTGSVTVTTPGGGLIDLGGGDISHLSDAKKQEIYNQFKAQPATYLSSPAQDIWAALLDISDNNGLTKMQTLRVIDDVGAKKVSKNDEHLFEKKIKDWLQTPAGYAILHNLPIPKPDTPKFAPGVEGKIPTFEESNKYSYPVLPVSETTKWFDKALKSHGVKPSSAALSGVTSYTGGIYHSINAYLYGGVESISSSNNSAMVNAQRAMIPSVEPVLLHRGAGYNSFKAKSFADLQKMVGQTRWMGGFGSTSTGGSSAFGGQVSIEIEAPPGTPMYWAKPISLHKSENEMLLAAGLYYRIISVTSKYGGATVRVRIVPKPEDESQIIAAGEMRW